MQTFAFFSKAVKRRPQRRNESSKRQVTLLLEFGVEKLSSVRAVSLLASVMSTITGIL